jgi:hypothetical protein
MLRFPVTARFVECFLVSARAGRGLRSALPDDATATRTIEIPMIPPKT